VASTPHQTADEEGLSPVSGASLAPQASVGYQVNHLARLLAQALRERIEPLGVVPGQFAQLLALYEQDGLTQAELCARVRIEQPTMASTLARMQRDGLIDRVPDPADGRRALVTLTPRARELQDQLIATARAVNSTATRGLDPSQTTAFLAALACAIDNLDPTHDKQKEEHFMTSTTIATDHDVATLINVFTDPRDPATPRRPAGRGHREGDAPSARLRLGQHPRQPRRHPRRQLRPVAQP